MLLNCATTGILTEIESGIAVVDIGMYAVETQLFTITTTIVMYIVMVFIWY